MKPKADAFALIEGRWLFDAGRNDYDAARQQAKDCPGFSEDDEDEQVDDITRSCYNCAYRRWSPTTFECILLSRS